MKKQAEIKVDMNNISSHKINPYIFGNFVEDIRDHMDAMLAYLLKNMDFEKNDNNNDGVSDEWYPITNNNNAVFAVEPAARYHSGHSQKIHLPGKSGFFAGIAQKIKVKMGIKYDLKIYARATEEINCMNLDFINLDNQQVLVSESIDVRSHEWKEYTTTIIFNEDCNNIEFRLIVKSGENNWPIHMSKGNLWIDHVSILPSDSIFGVKKEVYDMTKRLNCGLLRLGGNEISGYHWQEFVGPDYLRPNKKSEAWGHWLNKYFGTDEFLLLCEELSVEPLICINAGSGTPEEAARWVEYCNGSSDTPMGRLRAENGRVKPYNVKYWEVGNEIYGDWQIGHCSAKEFGKRYLEFYKAMEEVDSDIKFLACGDNEEWNQQVLDIAGRYIDYLTIHIYHSYGYRYLNIPEDSDRHEKYKGQVSFPEVTHSILKETEKIIKNSKDYSHVKIAITEYNTMYYPNTVRKELPNEHTLEAAIANAANLNEFLRYSHLLEIATFSDLVNGWLGGCIRVGDYYADQFLRKKQNWTGKDDIVYGTPSYYVLEMYSNTDIYYIVESTVLCDKYSIAKKNIVENIPLNNIPELDVVTCLNESKDLLTIFVTNRSFDEIELEIGIDKYGINGEINIKSLTSDDIDNINDVLNPQQVISTTSKACYDAGKIKQNISANSVNIIEIFN